MPESSTNPAEEGHPFDVERFARETIHAIEYDDDWRGVIEVHLIRVEECVAARWPRRWLLWARLRREIRASTGTWDPRDSFLTRRISQNTQEADDSRQKRMRHHKHPEQQTTGFQRHTGWDSAETGQPGGGGAPLGPPWNMPGDDGQPGGADPGAGAGAGYLP